MRKWVTSSNESCGLDAPALDNTRCPYRIVQRIQQDNSAAAAQVAKTLYEGCASLKGFPYRGREGRIEGTRELVFPDLPYIVVYRIEDQIVDVVRIYHGAQDWP